TRSGPERSLPRKGWRPRRRPATGPTSSNSPQDRNVESSLEGLDKKIIHRHRPAWDCRFCLGHFTAPVDPRMLRIACPVASHDFVSQNVHIPHYPCSGREVVGTLPGLRLLRRGAIVTFAPDFRCEHRRAIQELPASRGAQVECGIGAEGLTVRQVDNESDIVRHTAPPPRAFLVFIQSQANLKTGAAR